MRGLMGAIVERDRQVRLQRSRGVQFRDGFDLEAPSYSHRDRGPVFGKIITPFQSFFVGFHFRLQQRVTLR